MHSMQERQSHAVDSFHYPLLMKHTSFAAANKDFLTQPGSFTSGQSVDSLLTPTVSTAPRLTPAHHYRSTSSWAEEDVPPPRSAPRPPRVERQDSRHRRSSASWAEDDAPSAPGGIFGWLQGADKPGSAAARPRLAMALLEAAMTSDHPDQHSELPMVPAVPLFVQCPVMGDDDVPPPSAARQHSAPQSPGSTGPEPRFTSVIGRRSLDARHTDHIPSFGRRSQDGVEGVSRISSPTSPMSAPQGIPSPAAELAHRLSSWSSQGFIPVIPHPSNDSVHATHDPAPRLSASGKDAAHSGTLTPPSRSATPPPLALANPPRTATPQPSVLNPTSPPVLYSMAPLEPSTRKPGALPQPTLAVPAHATSTVGGEEGVYCPPHTPLSPPRTPRSRRPSDAPSVGRLSPSSPVAVSDALSSFAAKFTEEHHMAFTEREDSASFRAASAARTRRASASAIPEKRDIWSHQRDLFDVPPERRLSYEMVGAKAAAAEAQAAPEHVVSHLQEEVPAHLRDSINAARGLVRRSSQNGSSSWAQEDAPVARPTPGGLFGWLLGTADNHKAPADAALPVAGKDPVAPVAVRSSSSCFEPSLHGVQPSPRAVARPPTPMKSSADASGDTPEGATEPAPADDASPPRRTVMHGRRSVKFVEAGEHGGEAGDVYSVVGAMALPAIARSGTPTLEDITAGGLPLPRARRTSLVVKMPVGVAF